MEEFDLNNSPDLEPESVKERLGQLLEEAAQTQTIIEHWQEQQKAVKDEAWTLLAIMGGKFQGEGGELVAVQPGTTNSYDSPKLDALLASLETAGLKNVAAALRSCKRTSQREGYVRFSLKRA